MAVRRGRLTLSAHAKGERRGGLKLVGREAPKVQLRIAERKEFKIGPPVLGQLRRRLLLTQRSGGKTRKLGGL